MIARPHRVLRIVEPADLDAARRELRLMAQHLDWPPEDVDRLGVRLEHLQARLWGAAPRDGALLYRLLDGGLELLAGGLGAPDPEGLQALGFQVHHTPEGRTVAVDRLGDPGEAEVGGVSVPLAGFSICGDGWAWRRDGGILALLVVDGLGHGPAAGEARERVLDLFSRGFEGDAEGFLARANTELRSTRGAVMALALLDPTRERLRYLGVGNIAGWKISGGGSSRLVSLPGALGLAVAPLAVQVFEHDWPEGSTLVLATDGVRDRLPDDDELWSRPPVVIAAALFLALARGSDDAAVAVARLGEAP